MIKTGIDIHHPTVKVFLYAGLFAVIFLLFYILPFSKKPPPMLHAGRLNWSLTSKVVSLTGEWEYQPGITLMESRDNPEWANLPQTWKHHFGSGSYRIVISGLEPGMEYGILFPYQATSCNLFINGILSASNGTVGTDRKSSIPGYKPEIVHYRTMGTSMELILQVSNFHHRRGGPFQVLYFGEGEKISRLEFWNVIRDWAFVVMYLTMGLYQLAFYAIRKDRSALYLTLFFMFTAINGMVGTPEVLLFRVLPDFSWGFYQKICYYVSYTTPLFLLLFVNRLYGGIPRKILILISLPLLAIDLFVSLFPSRIFTLLNSPFQVYAVVVVGIVLAMLIAAFRRKAAGSGIILAGYGVIIGSMAGGILFSNNRITSAPFLPLSFLQYFNTSFFGNHLTTLTTLSYIMVLLLLNILSLWYFIRHPGLLSDKKETPNDKNMVLNKDQVILAGKEYALSDRESEVAFLLLKGKTNKEICELLFISMSTVKTHISRIFKKTGVGSRSELFFLFQLNQPKEPAARE